MLNKKFSVIEAETAVIFGTKNGRPNIKPLTCAELALLTLIVVSSAGQAGRINNVSIVVNEVIVATGVMLTVSVVGTRVAAAVFREQRSTEVKNKITVSTYGHRVRTLVENLPTLLTREDINALLSYVILSIYI